MRKQLNLKFLSFLLTIPMVMSEGANDERIDILNEIDWSTKDAVLKAEFPMNVKNKEAVYDLGIGTIKRGNNTNVAYEVCAQQWADITDPDNRYGIAILNNCKYGWDKPNDNTLRLTLLHESRHRRPRGILYINFSATNTEL